MNIVDHCQSSIQLELFSRVLFCTRSMCAVAVHIMSRTQKKESL